MVHLRPPTVITEAGIERPWCRRFFVPWNAIDHLVAPTYESDVRVATTAGTKLRLFGVDSSLTADVAAFRGTPVRSHEVTVARPVTHEPSQREIEADVARRAAALSAERERLDEQNNRRRGPSAGR